MFSIIVYLLIFLVLKSGLYLCEESLIVNLLSHCSSHDTTHEGVEFSQARIFVVSNGFDI